ncbi:hypothetical protein FQN54_009567 [Arachnomyces sp. PD_36]|nr:hypothetical protein FQN54_009567 [Arachnomyces sp. PD_36]
MSTFRSAARSMQELRLSYQQALQQFSASSSPFRILETVPSSSSSNRTTPAVLYVLDSSFNPPTLAHLRIAYFALSTHTGSSPARLLLLLATQNADKPSKPASFEDRLVMMSAFAQDLYERLRESRDSLSIDIGVTKNPYFIDKAAAISSTGSYPQLVEQVHLTGFDTLVRIFDSKYYPPEHTLQPLGPFLSENRLRVTLRPDDGWGGREEQEAFLSDLAKGARESEGGKREWADRITLVEGRKEGEDVVSSTKAREAARAQDFDALKKLVTEGVGDWIISQGLYRDA